MDVLKFGLDFHSYAAVCLDKPFESAKPAVTVAVGTWNKHGTETESRPLHDTYQTMARIRIEFALNLNFEDVSCLGPSEHLLVAACMQSLYYCRLSRPWCEKVSLLVSDCTACPQQASCSNG